MADLSKLSDSDLDAMIAQKQSASKAKPSGPSPALAKISDDDLDKMIASKQEATRPKASVADTALEGFGKGASLGYLPQLQAAEQKGVEAIGDAKDKALHAVGLGHLASTDSQLREQGFDIPVETYVQARDANIKRQAQQAKDNPVTAKASEIAGELTTAVASSGVLPEAGVAKTLAQKVGQGALQGARTGFVYGAAQNPGDKAGVVDLIQPNERAENAEKGTAIGATIGGAIPVITKGISSGAAAASDKLKALAEKSAVNATGATGKQAIEFADDAGRQLLDRKIVRFGDSQEKIAERASTAVDEVNNQIDSTLSKLQKDGVTVDRNDIYNTVRAAINKLKSNESQADVAKALENHLNSVIDAADNGGTKIGVADAEVIKRGFNKIAKNWADPSAGQAGKTMYQTYRNAVEDAATKADPETAKTFIDAKKSFGVLSPVMDAAERRAATTAQSPAGGLADVAAAGAGAAGGGPVGAILAPLARRVIAPRVASSVAVSADAAADILRKIPQFAEMESSRPAAFQAFATQLATPTETTAPALMKAASNPPKKGEEKWATDGFAKLIEHTSDPEKIQQLQEMKEKLMKDSRSRRLLISASDLKPGSKAMQNLMDQIDSTSEKVK